MTSEPGVNSLALGDHGVVRYRCCSESGVLRRTGGIFGFGWWDAGYIGSMGCWRGCVGFVDGSVGCTDA